MIEPEEAARAYLELRDNLRVRTLDELLVIAGELLERELSHLQVLHNLGVENEIFCRLGPEEQWDVIESIAAGVSPDEALARQTTIH